MEDLAARSTQEVLDEHLNIAQGWEEKDLGSVIEEDLRRNVAEDVVVLTSRGTFRGHQGVIELAEMLGEELPDHNSFKYTHTSVEGRMGFLKWEYEDSTTRVRDGADSYLIEGGKIVAQTIHYTVEQK